MLAISPDWRGRGRRTKVVLFIPKDVKTNLIDKGSSEVMRGGRARAGGRRDGEGACG